MMTPEEVAELQAKVVEQFKNGRPLLGKDGAFAPMLKQFIESALEAEMSSSEKWAISVTVSVVKQ